MEDLRLIANPLLLASDRRSRTTTIVNDSFKEKLHKLLSYEYSDIYLSENTINKIHDNITYEINELMINRIINDCIESCIDEVINKNKFDFCIPFE